MAQEDKRMFGRLMVATPLVVALLALATARLWWPFAKKWLADHKLFYALIAENSALAIQRGRQLIKIYISVVPANQAHFEEIQRIYGEDKIKIVHTGNAIVWVGWPFFDYETVQKWFLTEQLEDAAREVDRHGTIPLKIMTTTFPALLMTDLDLKAFPTAKTEKEELQLIERHVREAQAGGPKLLASEVQRLMGIDVHESAEGFPVPFDVEVDWEIEDPWLFRTKVDYVGEAMISFLDQAARTAMASLRLVAMDIDPKNPNPIQVERRLEPRMITLTGLNTDDQGNPIVDSDMATEGVSIPPVNRLMTNVLHGMGVKIWRLRVTNLRLPESLMEELRKPASERASTSARIIKADGDIEVEDREAKALRKKGEGQRDYQKLIAEGDRDAAKTRAEGERATIEAYSDDGKSVNAEARAARLTRGAQEVWQAGVSSAADGKVLITGAPGAANDSLAGALAGAATILKEATSPATPASGDKPKATTSTTDEGGTETSEPPTP